MSDIVARLSTAVADRYRIERQLGVGGMATVYLAEDVKHQRQMAVKVLPECGEIAESVASRTGYWLERGYHGG
jgi:hypothetical protein